MKNKIVFLNAKKVEIPKLIKIDYLRDRQMDRKTYRQKEVDMFEHVNRQTNR